MSSAPNANTDIRTFEPSPVGALLSLVVPGLGQIYQGRFGKGLLFMVSLLSMFTLGQAMGNWQNVYIPTGEEGGRGRAPLATNLISRWHYIGQFWIGAASWPAIWQYLDMPMPSSEQSPFWHNYQKAPPEHEVNAFLVNSDKTPDLGWVYTVVAGMLNILVIYDAFAGPVFPQASRFTGKESLAPKPELAKEGAA